MKKCGRQCVICAYVKEGKYIYTDKFTWKINKKVDCLTQNMVYLIECQKENCRLRYLGESERSLKNRISEHIGYIKTNKISEATGEHFNLPGHTLSDLKVTIIEKVKIQDSLYRKERESYNIRRFNSYYKGMNKKP